MIEIKLGGDDNIEHGAKTLKKLKDTIDTDRMKEPSFMMVLVGKGKYAYRRDDGFCCSNNLFKRLINLFPYLWEIGFLLINIIYANCSGQSN